MLVFVVGVVLIVIIMVGVFMKDMFEKMNVLKLVLLCIFEDLSIMVLLFILWGIFGIYYVY